MHDNIKRLLNPPEKDLLLLKAVNNSIANGVLSARRTFDTPREFSIEDQCSATLVAYHPRVNVTEFELDGPCPYYLDEEFFVSDESAIGEELVKFHRRSTYGNRMVFEPPMFVGVHRWLDHARKVHNYCWRNWKCGVIVTLSEYQQWMVPLLFSPEDGWVSTPWSRISIHWKPRTDNYPLVKVPSVIAP